MSATAPAGELQVFYARIQECIAPFAGRIEYGNLRSKVTEWDHSSEGPVTNVALVYETPGGSTDQINISYSHSSRFFCLVDCEVEGGEFNTQCVETLMERIRSRVACIPQKRLEHLYGEIRRQLDNGMTTVGVVGHLNRMMNSGLRGGTMTHLEMRDAMSYAVRYLKGRSFPGAEAS